MPVETHTHSQRCSSRGICVSCAGVCKMWMGRDGTGAWSHRPTHTHMHTPSTSNAHINQLVFEFIRSEWNSALDSMLVLPSPFPSSLWVKVWMIFILIPMLLYFDFNTFGRIWSFHWKRPLHIGCLTFSSHLDKSKTGNCTNYHWPLNIECINRRSSIQMAFRFIPSIDMQNTVHSNMQTLEISLKVNF